MSDEPILTDREKVHRILAGLNLPAGQYAVGHSARAVLKGEMSETDMIVIYVSTALFMHLYETIEGGLIWGLWMPNPEDAEHLTDAPIIYTELLGIEVRATFACPPDQITGAAPVSDDFPWMVTPDEAAG